MNRIRAVNRFRAQAGVLWLVAVCLAFAGNLALALDEAGVVLMASGQVSVTGADAQTRTPARRSPIYVGDRFKTGTGSQLQLRMNDGAMIALGADAEFVVKAYSEKASGDAKDQAVLSLVQGGLRTISGHIDKSTYRMETPVATLGIRGTVFDVFVKADGTTIAILRQGAIDVNGAGRSVLLDVPGLASIVKPHQIPTEPTLPPADVLEYLRGVLPFPPDGVKWQDDGAGGVQFTFSDEPGNGGAEGWSADAVFGSLLSNVLNTQPPMTSGNGEPPVVPPPVKPACQPNSDTWCPPTRG